MTKFQRVKLIPAEGHPFKTQTTSVRCVGGLSALGE